MAKKNLKYTEIDGGKNFPTGISTHVDWEPRTNIVEPQEGDMWIIEVELPGVIKEDISIILEDSNNMVIRGIKKQPRSGDCNSVSYFLFGREFGSFYKRIEIPFQVDDTKIQTSMENGVLIIKLPRKKTGKVSVEIK
jgi:HSP20 family protein